MRSVANLACALLLSLCPVDGAAQGLTTDLSRWLSMIAGEPAQGRATGTREHAQVVAAIATAARDLGLAPPGPRRSPEQRIPLTITRIDTASGLTLKYRMLEMWDPRVNASAVRRTGPAEGPPLVPLFRHMLQTWDIVTVPYWITGGGNPRVKLDTSRVVIGARLGERWTPDSLPLKGRIVVVEPPVGRRIEEAVASDSIRAWLYQYRTADAVAMVGLEQVPPATLAAWREPTWTLPSTIEWSLGRPPEDTLVPTLLLLSQRATAAVLAHPDLVMQYYSQAGTRAPSAVASNLVFVLPGSDASLRDEYVVLAAPSDYRGIVSGQTYLGADDGGSGAAALLGVAKLLAAGGARPKRSIAFVWHAGTEQGLSGSAWLLRNPPIRTDKIVAALNVERLGRGSDTLYAVGDRADPSPLRGLVDVAAAQGNMLVDWSWDAAADPWQRDCRSDHLNYRRIGIPALTINSGIHTDWRRPTDRVEAIDLARYTARVTWLASVVRAAADDTSLRPKGRVRLFADELGRCTQ